MVLWELGFIIDWLVLTYLPVDVYQLVIKIYYCVDNGLATSNKMIPTM